jgi:hypothetical protein
MQQIAAAPIPDHRDHQIRLDREDDNVGRGLEQGATELSLGRKRAERQAPNGHFVRDGAVRFKESVGTGPDFVTHAYRRAGKPRPDDFIYSIPRHSVLDSERVQRIPDIKVSFGEDRQSIHGTVNLRRSASIPSRKGIA